MIRRHKRHLIVSHWVIRTVVALTLGIATTIFISQCFLIAISGGAIAQRSPLPIRQLSTPEHALQVINDGFGVERADARPAGTLINHIQRIQFEKLDRTPQWMSSDLDTWFTAQRTERRSAGYYAVSCGFPFRCFAGERRWTYLPNVPATTGTRDDKHLMSWPPAWTPSFLNPDGKREFLLPTRILSLGFAANAAVNGAAWLLLITTPGAFRRWRRRRRGLCTKCGYDLQGSIESCPECGAALLTPPSTPPSRA